MKTIYLQLFLFVLFCSLLSSCISNKKRIVSEITSLYGRTIDFPAILDCVTQDSVIYCAQIDSLVDFSRTTIVTYLDSSNCKKCALTILEYWHNVLLNNDIFDKTNFIVVVHSTNPNILRTIYKELDLPYKLFVDQLDTFMLINEISDCLEQNRTFLIDAERKVHLVGTPLRNKSLIELYKKEIEASM